jgi:hypothetical protein
LLEEKWMVSLFSNAFLTVRNDGHGRGEDVKQLAMGDINKPDEAGNDVEVPEKVGIDFNVSEELG